jgi:hypothetical protein
MNTFDPNKRVVLSALLPAIGGMMLYELTSEQAQKWLELGPYTNYVQHDTVRLIGIEPTADRLETGSDWGQALIVRAKGRLEPRREYTSEEFEAMGYEIWLALRFADWAWGYEGVAEAVPLPHKNTGEILYPPVPKDGTLYAGPGEIGLMEFLGYPKQELGGWKLAFTITPDDTPSEDG